MKDYGEVFAVDELAVLAGTLNKRRYNLRTARSKSAKIERAAIDKFLSAVGEAIENDEPLSFYGDDPADKPQFGDEEYDLDNA